MSDKKNIIYFLIISFLIFSSRWIPSFYSFDESISVRIILESITDGYYYYPLVKYLSVLDFNNSFNPNYPNLENVMIPFYSIFIHSFFYKFLGSFSFILIEYFSVFIFLIINYKLFKKYYSQEVAILFSIIVFSIPIIFSILPVGNINYLNLIKDNIFTLRFPRPLITSLYLFFFLYLIISFEKKEFINKKNFFILGIILALTLSSFYYFFFIQVIILLLYLFYSYKYYAFKKLFDNLDSIIILLVTFLILSIPLILNILYSESDYIRRLGINNINLDQKKLLFDHYLTKYIKKEFSIFFIIISIYLFYLNKTKKMNYKLVNLFYLFFISSAIAPLFFILITNKTGILYHFNNMVVIFAFLLILIIILDIFAKNYSIYFSNVTIKILSISLISICIFINIYNRSLETKNEINERLEYNEVSKLIIKNHNLSESTLLTFDNRFMVWSVLNDIKFLNLTSFIISPKKDEMIEDDLIKVFKFLKLDSNDFKSFIANKKTSWRYTNINLNTFFFYKYIANPVKTFNNSKDFEPEVYDYIMNSSPINFEQSIIPNSELIRLNNKFSSISLKNFNYPDIIILNRNSEFINQSVKLSDYCKVFNKDFFILMFKKKENASC
jgi:hypothetical protein